MSEPTNQPFKLRRFVPVETQSGLYCFQELTGHILFISLSKVFALEPKRDKTDGQLREWTRVWFEAPKSPAHADYIDVSQLIETIIDDIGLQDADQR